MSETITNTKQRGRAKREERGESQLLLTHLEKLDWSRHGFAARVHERCAALGLPYTVSLSTVSRWCANQTVPSPPLAAAACHVLSTALHQPITPAAFGWPMDTTDVTAEALEYRDLPHAVSMLTKLWELDSMHPHRRNLIRGGLAAGLFAAASHEALVMPPDQHTDATGQRRVTTADIQLITAQTELYTRLDAEHGGGRFRAAFASFLDTQATPLVRTGRFGDATGRRLYGAVADASTQLAFMAYDDHQPGFAQGYYMQAMRLAQAIGDRSRIARIHIHQARLTAAAVAGARPGRQTEAAGTRKDVVTYARSAVLAADGSPHLVRAYAAITEARAWAYVGDPALTQDAVHRARGAIERGQHEPAPAWLTWFDRHELEGQAAWAFAVAGLPDLCGDALRIANGKPAGLKRDNVGLLITAAELARLRGDAAEQEAFVKRASDSAKGISSRRVAARIARVSSGQPLDEF